MKLYVTLGISTGESVERVFEVADDEFVTYLGLEIDTPVAVNSVTGLSERMTIVRQPFIVHGAGAIHSICRLNDPERVEEVQL